MVRKKCDQYKYVVTLFRNKEIRVYNLFCNYHKHRYLLFVLPHLWTTQLAPKILSFSHVRLYCFENSEVMFSENVRLYSASARLQNSRFFSKSKAWILACEAREPHTLAPDLSFKDQAHLFDRSTQKIRLFCSLGQCLPEFRRIFYCSAAFQVFCSRSKSHICERGWTIVI